jgi:hypothetical protein
MKVKDEIEKARVDMIAAVNKQFDLLLARLDGEFYVEDDAYERSVPLTTKSHYFIGTKPSAVIIESEMIPAKTWPAVCSAILSQCLRDDRYRERLLEARDKVKGRRRTYLSRCPDGMTTPGRITDEVFFESHYNSARLINILTEKILKPIGYDCEKIRIVIKD